MNNVATSVMCKFFNSYARKFMCCFLLLTLGCNYHKITSNPYKGWLNKKATIRIANFANKTQKLGIEEAFLKALESRIVAASPWRLVAREGSSDLLLQATIEQCSITPLSFISGNNINNKFNLAADHSSRLAITIVASVCLLNGTTGDVLVDNTVLTFSRQYRVDVGIVGSYTQELNLLDSVLDAMADDFAESLLTQLLEGSN